MKSTKAATYFIHAFTEIGTTNFLDDGITNEFWLAGELRVLLRDELGGRSKSKPALPQVPVYGGVIRFEGVW